MTTLTARVLSGLLVATTVASADVSIREERIQFKPGATGAAIKGSIKGDETVDYTLRATAGQSMVVILESDNRFTYFNVLPPGSEEAIFVGSTSGDRFEGTLPASGDYTVRVYLMRNAARRGETATYTVNFGIAGRGSVAAAGGFDRTLELEGITFHVTCPNDSSLPTVTINPSGLAIDNSAVTKEVDGQVVGAEVADLNGDGSPEIYAYVQSVGSGSYGSLAAYSANTRKSLSEIYLPPITDDPSAARGYMGHDEFAVGEGRLLRRFPVYRDGDSNAKPTGGMRQLQYRLEPGEAGWILRVDKVVEY